MKSKEEIIKSLKACFNGNCYECCYHNPTGMTECDNQLTDTIKLIEQMYKDKENSRSYDQGMRDAWEIISKLFNINLKLGGTHTLEQIFNDEGICFQDIIHFYTPQEAIEKFREWEESKRIDVGDIVEAKDGTKALVLDKYSDDEYNVLTENRCCEQWIESGMIKTEKHVDLTGLFEQIEGNWLDSL